MYTDMVTHTRKQAITQTHTHKHTHTHARNHNLTLAHMQTHSHAQTLELPEHRQSRQEPNTKQEK